MLTRMIRQAIRSTTPRILASAGDPPSPRAHEACEHPSASWQSRDRFLAMLAHDLQTPLTAIILTAATDVMHTGDDRQRARAARVLCCAQRMKRMVADMLDFARAGFVGRLPVHPEKVDLVNLAACAVTEIEDSHPGSHVRLEAEGDLQGEWDPARMGQVLVNLVSNAVQHGEDGAPVDVRLVRQPDSVRIEVVNRGRPISESEFSALFQPFARGPASRSGRGSVGLGLFIVSQVVAAHGGEVLAFNSPEAGTVTFAVHLPLRSAARE
jgi:signal transduction histidine kinase